MDTKFKVGGMFLRGFAYPTKWEVVNTKLIFDITQISLFDAKSHSFIFFKYF